MGMKIPSIGTSQHQMWDIEEYHVLYLQQISYASLLKLHLYGMY